MQTTKQKIESIIRQDGLTGAIKIVTWKDYGSINIESGSIEVDGNDILCSECLRIIEKLNSDGLSKHNVNVMLNKRLANSGNTKTGAKK